MTKLKSKIFIHGFLGQKEDWPVAPSDDISRIDLWEEIQNLNREDHGFQDWSESFLSRLPEQTEVYAYSLGARLALTAACLAPEKFKKLVFFSVNPGLKTKDEKEKRWQQDQKWMEQIKDLSWQEFTSKWQEQKVFENDPKLTIKEIDKELVIKALHYWSLAKQENLWPKLNQLPQKTYFLAGERDKKFASILEEIKTIRKNHCLLLKKVGHRIPFTYKGDLGDWHWQS